jgi:uncharacterized protein YqhQ
LISLLNSVDIPHISKREMGMKGRDRMAKFYYGGQAVMEGVMMRGRRSAALAVRRPDGEIYLYEEELDAQLYQNRWFRLPFLRGMLLLWEMLVLGTRLMTLSANIATGAIDPNASSTRAALAEAATLGMAGEMPLVPQKEEKPEQIGGAALIFTLVISLTFAVGIFFVGPLLLASLFRNQIGQGVLSLIVEGVIRLALLVGYLAVIGRVPDVQRVFGYHGAEHKAINAFEHGEPLDVAHVRRASRVHTRCGTGFLLLVMVVSIIVFAFFNAPSLPLKIVSRIVLVPVVAGIAYELMRLGAANYRYRIVRWLLAPGLALQGLTTREPEDSMIECAIAALKRVLRRDEVVSDDVGEPDAALPSLGL